VADERVEEQRKLRGVEAFGVAADAFAPQGREELLQLSVLTSTIHIHRDAADQRE
jgi:hypothetical protein